MFFFLLLKCSVAEVATCKKRHVDWLLLRDSVFFSLVQTNQRAFPIQIYVVDAKYDKKDVAMIKANRIYSIRF